MPNGLTRLTEPMVRDRGELRVATWDEALDRASEGLQRAVEQSNRVTVQVRAPAPALRETLSSVDGVRRVDLRTGSGDDGLLTADCQVDGRKDVEAAIARAVAVRWDLHRLERQQPTLENVFLQYVNAGPARGAAR